MSAGSGRRDGSVVTWQWKDDDGTWRNYSAVDSGVLEDAYIQGEDEISLSTLGTTYTVDFTVMLQINEDTGNSRSIMRRRVGPEDRGEDALSAASLMSVASAGSSLDPDAPGLAMVNIKMEDLSGGDNLSGRQDARAKLLITRLQPALPSSTSA